ncbi:MAG: FtsX-like permease family protein [Proteobacteria bacterium]|nr:FtsX-like permease family protein [Pseudomonadota bacterium]
MIRPRWRKLFRDVVRDRGRSLMAFIAVTVGVFGFATILTAFSILTREIRDIYASTNPASATIEVDAVTETMLAKARAFPGISQAEARAVVLARAKIGNEWFPMLLFVIDDFDAIRLNIFRRISGAWPPPLGAMLVERSALRLLGPGEQKAVVVKTPNGRPTEVPIAGVVHDMTLAPAWQERYGYGYIRRETLTSLGEAPLLDELRVRFEGDHGDVAIIEAKAQALAVALREQGAKVRELKVPPPKKHPHQDQMMAVLALFIAFAALALLLSAVLVAAVLAAMLARQVREIGVMKALGAGTGQIARMYLAMILLLGIASVAVGLPFGLACGTAFARTIADDLLNFTILSAGVPFWVYAAVIGSGVLVPVLVAMPIIIRGTQLTVREAISDFGVATASFGRGPFDAILGALRGFGLPYVLAMRNMFRRRGRLVMALALLAAGGGIFITGLNVRDGWENFADRVNTDRFYDFEFRLSRPTASTRIANVLDTLPGIARFESWGYAETAIARAGQIDVARVYPDRSHGSFVLLGIPADTSMIRFPLLAGRWLRPSDNDAVVLNQTAAGVVAGAKLGERILLSVDGRPTSWRLTGIVEEVGSPPAAYVTADAFAAATGAQGVARMLRIATTARDPAERGRIVAAIEAALDDAGIGVERGLPRALLRTAMGDHVAVLVAMLLATAGLLALIGALGLASTMTMNVVERTREIGVMRSIGAMPEMVLRIIVGEGLFVGVLSWFLAVLVSLPLSATIGSIVGRLAFRTPLALTVSTTALVSWLALVVVIAIAASAIPALRAGRLVIREALAYG